MKNGLQHAKGGLAVHLDQSWASSKELKDWKLRVQLQSKQTNNYFVVVAWISELTTSLPVI